MDLKTKKTGKLKDKLIENIPTKREKKRRRSKIECWNSTGQFQIV